MLLPEQKITSLEIQPAKPVQSEIINAICVADEQSRVVGSFFLFFKFWTIFESVATKLIKSNVTRYL